MEKYFSIELRLARGAVEVSKGLSKLVDKFYYGDGYIRIQNDTISGFIALDYIEGKIGEDVVEIYLYTEDAEVSMEISKDDFYLPQNFLMIYDDIVVELCIKEAVSSPQKRKSICDAIEEAQKYSMEYWKDSFP